ncbi:choice-of-anchor A family protein [Kitasatospora sp. YST-16]|uniref:choice-of-anchor A family protein n=1 Tax=Kitasatospora sp. YST-16 TaxID=2998080 RepID=UPI002285134A|nr:choice-of-anchor A family protein [Kitasatospora sp. YST-16]WAL71636.1 choice-of-anchor A family protein [Kitasatospora sp. YST-16]
MRHGVRGKNPLLRFAVVTALAATPLLTLVVAGEAAQMTPPLGPCSGDQCPGTWGPPHTGPFIGADASLNVFVGGDYLVRQNAAEVEGKIAVLGNLDINKVNGGAFNMGVVGVGSMVTPPSETDHVTVGGSVTIDASQDLPSKLLMGGYYTDGTGVHTVWGNLKYGTALTGTYDITPPGQPIKDPAGINEFKPLRQVIEDESACMAKQTATGTVFDDETTVTFTGDGTSARQVFNYDRSIGTNGGRRAIVFAGIPAGATVIVNMTGSDVTVNTSSGTGQAGDQLTELRPNLMWNFPTATDVTVTGDAQWQGSIMAGNAASTTTLANPGTNGRVYLAGNLTQTSATGTMTGTEIHNYPFNGDLPDCNESPSPSPSPSDSTSPSPSPSPSPSTSESPSPSPSGSGSPSPSPSPSPSGSTSPAPSPSGSTPQPTGSGSTPAGPPLPNTGGDSLVAPAAGAAAVLLGLGGAVIALARRARGRHSRPRRTAGRPGPARAPAVRRRRGVR